MDNHTPLTYRIQVRGRLDSHWSNWFNGMTVTVETGGDAPPLTTLVGPIADQSQLRGILTRIWNLNLVLVSVLLLEQDEVGNKLEG